MALTDELAMYALGYYMHESHPLRIDGLCLNTIQRRTPCEICSDVCPKGLEIHKKKPNWHGCINCNLCVSACPTQAIHESSTNLSTVMSIMDAPGDYAILACDRFEGNADLRLACISSLPWEVLATLALSRRIVLRTKPCKDCPDPESVERLKGIIKHLREFFGPEGFKERFHTVPPKDGHASWGASKRQAFSSAFNTVKTGADRILSKDAPKMSHYRAVLLDVLSAMPEEDRPELTWRTLEEDGDCRACEICSKICPHEAIEIRVPGYSDIDPKERQRL